MLQSLNQLHQANAGEFVHIVSRLKTGLTISREEARAKVSEVKEHNKKVLEFGQSRPAKKVVKATEKNTPTRSYVTCEVIEGNRAKKRIAG